MKKVYWLAIAAMFSVTAVTVTAKEFLYAEMPVKMLQALHVGMNDGQELVCIRSAKDVPTGPLAPLRCAQVPTIKWNKCFGDDNSGTLVCEDKFVSIEEIWKSKDARGKYEMKLSMRHWLERAYPSKPTKARRPDSPPEVAI